MLRNSLRAIPRAFSRSTCVANAALSSGSWGEILNGTVPVSPDTPLNKARMEELVKELQGNVAKVQLGGGEKAQAKHRARGKMIARDRINGLVDPGSPFLELGTLAGFDMYNDWIPSGGIVTGIGRVKG
jgi:3-methylcrotonyl-CoA carboxylase beta subunit